MQLEARKHLYDIKRAADLVTEFTAGKGFGDYATDAMLRAAVEREFEIIGEAEIDDRLVWDVVESKLPALRRDVSAMVDPRR